MSAATDLGAGWRELQSRARAVLPTALCPGTTGEWLEVFVEGRGISGGEPPVAFVPPMHTDAVIGPQAAGAGTPGPALRAGQESTRGRGTIRFLTPARFKVRNQLAHAISFRGLVFAMLRRVLEVAHFHVPGAAADWAIRPLLERAEEVRVVRSDLRWHDWERYSARQETRMALGGLLGSLEVEGDLAPFEPLLSAAEVLHVGKGTTFGLGKLEWSQA